MAQNDAEESCGGFVALLVERGERAPERRGRLLVVRGCILPFSWGKTIDERLLREAIPLTK